MAKSDRRTIRLPVMLSEEEMALVDLASRYAGLGVGPWCRTRLLPIARREAAKAFPLTIIRISEDQP